MSKSFPVSDIQEQFSAANSQAVKPRPKRIRSSPFAVRFSEGERAYLKKKAGNLSLGTYIRQELLADYDGATTQPRRKLHQPTVDQKIAGQLLEELGQSQIPNNLNQLAKAAHTGTLGTPQEVEQQLQDACGAVLAMREALFIALGLRCGGDE